MKRMRQKLALLLSATVLATSVFPNSVSAAAPASEKEVRAEEVKDYSRIDESSYNEQLDVAMYEDDELVTVIVEMEESPLLDYYNASEESMVFAEEDSTSGEKVAEFLASEEAQALEEELLEGQNEIAEQVEELSEDANVLAQWTSVTNAFAVEIPYGELASIQEMDGVKRAYVQHEYERPEEETSLDLTNAVYSYSLDMIGTNEAWENGYTGKGILVAILDTGIDVIQDKTNGAYIGSHEVFTEDSFKSGNPLDGENDWELRYDEASMTSFLAETALWANTSAVDEKTHITYDNNALYKNVKVPYGFDYADWDVNTRPGSSNHGVHVAGTAAGYAETEEGEVLFSGVAPDAQILAMKVFPDEDGGAEELSLVCALEDSIKLGADIVNLSLGSDNGYANEDTMQDAVYARVEAAGIVLMTSAGNSDDCTDENNYGGYNTTANPEISMMSSPAIHKSNLAVASIDNLINVSAYLTTTVNGEETETFFTDSTGNFKVKYSDKEYPVYLVDGVGTYTDFYNANFNNGYNGGKTGFALVKRGEIAFTEKLSNAANFHGFNSRGEAYGVIGVIVYDNNPEGEDLITMSVDGASVDSCFISGKAGEALAAALRDGQSVTFKASAEDKVVEGKTAGQMSSFTSWGAGSALELKPEITAPGGNIWSSVVNSSEASDGNYKGTYQMMSGTSMAAPHMTGAGALVRQRVNTSGEFGAITNAEAGDIVSQLLVSTAIPQKDEYGEYYSPRQQGAGLVNVGAATSTKVYVSVEGQNVGKLELGDDVEKTGKYDLNFNLNNVATKDIAYNMSVVLMAPYDVEGESAWGDRNFMVNYDYTILSEDLGKVTAKAGRVTSVSKTVELDEEVKAYLDESFENGIYVEGYVILTAEDETNPTLGLPVLAFYGDWTKAPIFDSANWNDEVENVYEEECTWNFSILGSAIYDTKGNTIGYLNLGQNAFASDYYEQKNFHNANIALSPDGDGILDKIDDIILYQVRNAKVVVLEAKDANTGELYYREAVPRVAKTVYESSYGIVVPYSLYYKGSIGWDGTDLEGNTLADGTQVKFSCYAYTDGDYSNLGTTMSDYYGIEVTDFDALIPGEKEPTFNGHAMDMAGDVITCDIVIDTEAPKLKNNAVSIYEKDGHTYLKGTVYDEEGSLASVEVAPLVTRSLKDKSYNYPSSTAVDRVNTFYSNTIYDAATKTLEFEVDVTEYEHTIESLQGENSYYDYDWDGIVYLSCGDYAANDRTYAIKVDATEGIVLSQTSALLHPGDTFELSVNNNTKDAAELTRTSSNTEVATIDEYGNVVAVAEGQAIITVTDGTDSAICVVAVEERPTEVIDFQLSVSKIDGLKANGQATVKVVNLYPADVVITENRWTVSEDDDYAADYAEGLVSIEKNSEDGLSGNVYLVAEASDELLPGGHATLSVTINGVTRTADVNWDDLPTSSSEDGLKVNATYQDQVVYTTPGEAAELSVMYKNNSLHAFGDVMTELEGLVLDGPVYFSQGGSYTAKLVPEKGYKLPESIKMYTRYDYGSGYYYDSERYADSYYGYFYNKETGEITVNYAPTGATTKLRIVASGVEDASNTSEPVLSGEEFVRPDSIYGPFDWEVVSGEGTLETFEYTNSYGESYEMARYVSDKPEEAVIRVSSKNASRAAGSAYSLLFTVVTEGVKADNLEVENHKLTLTAGEKAKPVATLSPEPTLASDENLVWTSFNEEVVTVDENGELTAVSEGKAYVRVASKSNTKVNNYIIVTVLAAEDDEPSQDDPSKDDTSKDPAKDPSKDPAGEPAKDPAKDETSKDDSSKDETSKDETSKDETSKDETSKDDPLKNEIPGKNPGVAKPEEDENVQGIKTDGTTSNNKDENAKNNGETPSQSTAPAAAPADTTTKTGDASMPAVYVSLIVVGLGLVILGKKKREE